MVDITLIVFNNHHDDWLKWVTVIVTGPSWLNTLKTVGVSICIIVFIFKAFRDEKSLTMTPFPFQCYAGLGVR